MERNIELPPEDFDYVVGQNGLYAYGRRYGPSPQACPHMQGAAFYQFIDSPQVRECQRCRKMWYCTPECQKEFWPTHQQHCVDQYSSLPISGEGLGFVGSGSLPFSQTEASTSNAMVPAETYVNPTLSQSHIPAGLNLDMSSTLRGGVVNKNALGKKAAYDQLTPALVALFGRHAPASQRLIWCNTKSNDDATKKARKQFATIKSDWTDVMKYAHSQFLATRMRGAIIINVDTPCSLGDYLLGSERFNWISYPDAQMTLCVKLQETIKAYNPSRAFVLVVYALSPDQLSAALWAWTYTDFARADPPRLMDMRIRIRQIMKDTKRAEHHMYQVQKDQDDS